MIRFGAVNIDVSHPLSFTWALEKIGRAKYIEEADLAQFDEILKNLAAEMKALSEGGAENV